jgi:hypothetical protein
VSAAAVRTGGRGVSVEVDVDVVHLAHALVLHCRRGSHQHESMRGAAAAEASVEGHRGVEVIP